ncbi:hypothetical protein [Nocardia asteroides]|uniref:hypothetical protein n=1 Tax=Nocardia asteroides TaxID=1824 RepID=UPI001E4B47BA|nr:hypothetical protein [Nocardia asteroides]UGT56705.1 hypothetical protein LTT85_07530 [Nocardia asteroides]
MSTATGALQSYDHTAYPEPAVRRRRPARARRPFSLVRGGDAVSRRTPRQLPRPARESRPEPARAEVSRGPAAEVFAGYGTAGPAAARAVLVEASPRPADAALDIAFATVPRTDSPAPRAARPARADRGPRAAGRPAAGVLYHRVSGVGSARGAHPVRRVERAQIGFATLAVVALATALVVMAFLGLAHVRAGSFSDRVEPMGSSISQSEGAPSAELSETVR